TIDGRSVEVAVCTLHQTTERVSSIGAVSHGTEAVQRSQNASRSDLEDGSTATAGALRIGEAAVLGYAVEVSVRALNECSIRLHSVRAVKAEQRGENLGGSCARQQSEKNGENGCGFGNPEGCHTLAL